jgi:predicted enzyme related to lactoylglutathione lyase
MIQRGRYVIAVPDLRCSSAYYHDVLDFEVLEIPDPGWRFFRRDNCLIMAGESRESLSPAKLGDHSYFAYLEVDNIDELYAAVKARGAEVAKSVRSEAWGMREFGIRTIDGHRIMFGSSTAV